MQEPLETAKPPPPLVAGLCGIVIGEVAMAVTGLGAKVGVLWAVLFALLASSALSGNRLSSRVLAIIFCIAAVLRLLSLPARSHHPVAFVVAAAWTAVLAGVAAYILRSSLVEAFYKAVREQQEREGRGPWIGRRLRR